MVVAEVRVRDQVRGNDPALKSRYVPALVRGAPWSGRCGAAGDGALKGTDSGQSRYELEASLVPIRPETGS